MNSIGATSVPSASTQRTGASQPTTAPLRRSTWVEEGLDLVGGDRAPKLAGQRESRARGPVAARVMDGGAGTGVLRGVAPEQQFTIAMTVFAIPRRCCGRSPGSRSSRRCSLITRSTPCPGRNDHMTEHAHKVTTAP
jgi:hypothetical protein